MFLAVPILKIGHLGSATEPPQQPRWRWRRVIQLTPSQRARERRGCGGFYLCQITDSAPAGSPAACLPGPLSTPKTCMSLRTLREENIHCLFSPSSSRVWEGSAPPSSLPGFYFGKLQPGKMGKAKRNGQSELLASSCMTMKINLGRNGRRVGGAVRGARSAGLATTN